MREADAEARTYGRSAGLLAAGVGSAGILTYAYFSLASHNLDAESYGEIVVLWSAVFVSISVLYRPVEQLLSRTIAERRAQGTEIGSALRVAATIQLAVAVSCAIAILALRAPIEDDLLSGSSELYWVMFAAVIAFGASFFARGYLAGRRRFGLLAGLLVCESASRAAFALAVALGIANGQSAIALGIAAAPLFSLVVVPLAFSRRATDDPVAAAPGGSVGRVSLASGGGFAAAVFVVMLSEQTLLNAGPLLVRGFSGAAAAGYIFNVLMLARAPLLVFQGVATSLLPHLTRLRSQGAGGADAFRLSLVLTLRAIAVFTALVAVVVALAGPAADAGRVLGPLRLRPRRSAYRDAGDGPLPGCDDTQPGRARAGPGTRRRRLLGDLRRRVPDLGPHRRARGGEANRGRVRRGGARARARARPRQSRRRHPRRPATRLGRGDRGAARDRRRGVLTGR